VAARPEQLIVAAVTGSLARPDVMVAGRYRGKGLEMIGCG
jgi:hypothetical protein